jgi:hypothetical protein
MISIADPRGLQKQVAHYTNAWRRFSEVLHKRAYKQHLARTVNALSVCLNDAVEVKSCGMNHFAASEKSWPNWLVVLVSFKNNKENYGLAIRFVSLFPF